MIAIVDYGMGNLLSVYNALEMLGAKPKVCSHAAELQDAERIILPGVGAFRDCMKHLAEGGFVEALQEAVLQRARPIFGICLGMQAMARTSSEGGRHQGLGWFAADVVRLTPSDPSLRVPQIGWNETEHRRGSPMFAGLPSKVDFYFVHSYSMKCDDPATVEATCDYGGAVTAAVRKDNIFATQFHPEKSQDHGLKMLENFLRWNP
jgi:glutamine amidotransferase